MRIQIQITDSELIPDKFFVSHYPDEKLKGEVVSKLSNVLMAFGKKMGDIVIEECLTGEDNPETVG